MSNLWPLKHLLLIAEWELCKRSNLEPEYGSKESFVKQEADRQGVPVNEVCWKTLREELGTEVWAIPMEWLDKQESITEISE